MGETWFIQLFGELKIQGRERVIERLRTQKTVALLALLALKRGPLRREELCEILWPDALPELARNSLSAALSALRRELGNDWVCADRFTIGLAPGAFETDVARFEAALREGDFACATQLYRGHFLPSCFEEPLLAKARELEERARGAFAAHLEQLEADAKWDDLIGAARRSLALFPNTLGAQLVLMRAHQNLCQFDAALEVFRQISNAARRENEPVPDAARHLARQIRRQRESHDFTPPASHPPAPHALAETATDADEATPATWEAPNLPTTWTQFFGRDEEIEALYALLSQGERLVTLSGMGGTGKTRLLLEVARRCESHFGGRVGFVPLAALSDAELLFSTIRDALRLPVTPDLPPFEQIVEGLKATPTLLLLDNFEQLVEGGAARVHELRTALPQCAFLISSRVLLNLPAEREWPVTPLPTPGEEPHDLAELEAFSSVALFVARAQSARPGWTLTAQNAGEVAALCRHLDGIPLALELAAARVRVLSPAQILERLQSRLDLLQTRELGVPQRQRTLSATIEWSFKQLAPAEAELFGRLSVFRGGWTLEAAETICADDAVSAFDVPDHLERLRENSMILTVETPAGPRFRLLEVLREWGAGELQIRQPALVEALRARHFAFYREMIEGTRNPSVRARHVGELEVEDANFRAALAWALERDDACAANDAARLAGALCWWWENRVHYSEGLEWVTRVLRKDGAVEKQWRARLLCGAGSIALCCGDLAPAQSLLEEGLALCRALDDKVGKCFALHRLSVALMLRGDCEGALDYAQNSLQLARELGDPALLFSALTALGWTCHNSERHTEAQAAFRENIALARQLKQKGIEAINLGFLGYSLLLEGQHEQAYQYLQRGYEMGQQAEVDPWTKSLTRAMMALGARECGELEVARAVSPLVVGEFHRIGTRWEVVCSLNDCALLAGKLENPELSAQLFGAADALAERIGFRLLLSVSCLRAGKDETLRQTLGEAAWQNARDRGAALSMDEVIALAETV